MKYTDEQLKDWARKYVVEAASELDFVGVGEMFEEDWEPFDLDFDATQDLMRKVHDLACAATVTVTWPDSITEEERLAEILWDARKATLGYDAATFPLGEMPANQREQYRRFATEVAKRLDPDRDAATLLRETAGGAQ
ncbi:hypothetical protein [Actinomadura sp. WMMA1423]|uniref:hypothetical protein n=1 Tax=Actinomadura sp. WMMA1423 TaxID=2591108 RepID=UPI0011467627|nr:hypothetical protein [Actinomadura sp. WMMA1423]